MSQTYEEVRDGILWDDEYAAEIQRRVAEIDAGTAETIDSDEAIASVRRLLYDVRHTSLRR